MLVEQETFSRDDAGLRSIPVNYVGNLPEQGFDRDPNTRIDTAVERSELRSEPGFSTTRRAHRHLLGWNPDTMQDGASVNLHVGLG
jgi:hypothetical protein